MMIMDANHLIELLNKALANEWLAYYQYWVGAQVVEGPLSAHVAAELREHAEDELKHAEMLSKRIKQLEGRPLLSPAEWFKTTNCEYEAPENPSARAVLQQNIKGERCAIEVYQGMLQTIQDQDPTTYHMIVEIREEELEHENDLRAILEDMDRGPRRNSPSKE